MPPERNSAGTSESSQTQVGVLVIEDDPLVASYIAEVLVESGFRVAGLASSGAEALSIAGSADAALALVDIRLAGPMDGIEVACTIREQHNIGAIFLTGIDDPEIRARAAAAAPYGFLKKPFLPSQVYNAITIALTRLAATRK
jgi:DNA-binding response OmpR family regulator